MGVALGGGPGGVQDAGAEGVLDEAGEGPGRVRWLGGEGFRWFVFLRRGGDHAEGDDLNGAVGRGWVAVELLELEVEGVGQFGEATEGNGKGSVLAMQAEVGEALLDDGVRVRQGGQGFVFNFGQERGQPGGISQGLEELTLAELFRAAGGCSVSAEQSGVGGTRICVMPSSSAMAQACWGPAPPNARRV